MDQQFAYTTSTACSEGCGGCCVEVATNVPGVVSVRDTEQRIVQFTPQEWNAFLTGAKSGEFDI